MKNGGIMILFGIGFVMCVVAGVAWLRKEDNGFSKLADGVKTFNSTLERIEKKYDGMIVDYTAQQAANKVIADTQTQLLNRMQMLEMRMDADSRKSPQVVIPSKMKLELSEPLKVTPVTVVYRQGPPIKMKKPTPLLDKAGVTKKKEVTQ